MRKNIYALAALVCTAAIAASAEHTFPKSEAEDSEKLMSKEYWAIWNPDVQRKIDENIEKNRKADAVVNLGELAESKLGGPVKSGDPKEFESWYSFSSREDCRNNVLSIRYSYEGVNSDGNSVSALVAAKSKEADAAVRSAIEKALKSFDAFSAPLSKSLSDKESFKAAISACSELSQSLQKAQEVLK